MKKDPKMQHSTDRFSTFSEEIHFHLQSKDRKHQKLHKYYMKTIYLTSNQINAN